MREQLRQTPTNSGPLLGVCFTEKYLTGDMSMGKRAVLQIARVGSMICTMEAATCDADNYLLFRFCSKLPTGASLQPPTKAGTGFPLRRQNSHAPYASIMRRSRRRHSFSHARHSPLTCTRTMEHAAEVTSPTNACRTESGLCNLPSASVN